MSKTTKNQFYQKVSMKIRTPSQQLNYYVYSARSKQSYKF